MEARSTIFARLFWATCAVLYVIGCGAVSDLDIGDVQTGGRGGLGRVFPGAGGGGVSSAGGAAALGSGGTACCKATPPTCHAIPTCDKGDKELSGACPPSRSCYARSSCGATVTCLSADSGKANPVDAATCDPSAEYNRFYVATSTQRCAVLDYPCPATIPTFSNGCGCGCEQDPSCPERADCSASDPFICTYAGRLKCPFTKR